MTSPYPLYGALVAINIPSDRARAELAEVRQEVALLCKDVDSRLALMSKDLEAVRSSMIIGAALAAVIPRIDPHECLTTVDRRCNRQCDTTP